MPCPACGDSPTHGGAIPTYGVGGFPRGTDVDQFMNIAIWSASSETERNAWPRCADCGCLKVLINCVYVCDKPFCKSNMMKETK